MSQTIASSLGILWTPPMAALNSGSSSINISAQYNAQSVGELDIPGATTVPTIFVIPFGSIASAKFLCIRNMMSADIGIRLNGVSSNEFQLSSGGIFMVSEAAAPTAVPLSSASIATTAIPGSTELVHYWIFGD